MVAALMVGWSYACSVWLDMAADVGGCEILGSKEVAVAMMMDGASNALAEEVGGYCCGSGSRKRVRCRQSQSIFETLMVIQGEHESSQHLRVTCIDCGWSQVRTFGERCRCCCGRGNTGGGMCCCDVD